MKFLYRRPLFSLLLHLFLGVVSSIFPLILALWLWVHIFVGFWQLLVAPRSKFSQTIFPLAYISGFEIAARASGTSPILPYEYAKYFFLFYLILLILKFNNARNLVGLSIVVLMLPGFFFIPTDNFRVNFVNSYLGTFILGLMATAYNQSSLKINELKSVLMCFSYGLVSLLVLVIVKTGNLVEIEFELAAMSSTTAGFGSNQVSTYLGAGILLMGLFWLMKWDVFKYKYVNIVLFGLFLTRGLLTFSRGGVMGALIALGAFYFIPKPKKGIRAISPFYLVLFIGISVFGFMFINKVSNNLLLERYRGETAATRMGRKDISVETLTTGRTNLMKAELDVFVNNPLFGVGPGNGYQERAIAYGRLMASHTEVTRLMAEHGIFGLIISLIFLIYPFIRIFSFGTYNRMFSTAFFILAIFTSFHAAMRTTITPFFWALGCMRFPEDNETVTQGA